MHSTHKRPFSRLSLCVGVGVGVVVGDWVGAWVRGCVGAWVGVCVGRCCLLSASDLRRVKAKELEQAEEQTTEKVRETQS